ncbi:hypothetical protein [Alloyangia pacifica]|uniref:hypothetical protein n=1 Tax=Alloyangia pacifica TaxID=311180 RepID=UPI00131F0B65|nr:hypothetical protein [Alloyangia pacifica]
MKTLTCTLAALAAALLTAAGPALACNPDSLSGCAATTVPEISALEGTAAIAALAAIVLLFWERRRHRAG